MTHEELESIAALETIGASTPDEHSAFVAHAFLGDARGAAAAVTEIVELRATNTAAAHDFDLVRPWMRNHLRHLDSARVLRPQLGDQLIGPDR